MQRPIGVTLLAIAAGAAGIFEIWRILVFLGITSFTFVGREVSFNEPQWGQAIWAAVLAAIWFWVAAGFWNVRGYAWMFGNFISLFTVIFGFFAILTDNGTTESEMIGWLLAIGIFFYLNYPGVQQHFVASERARLTPEQLAAMEQVDKANAAAAAAMAAPAAARLGGRRRRPPPPPPPPPAAQQPQPRHPGPGAAGRRSVQPGRVVRPAKSASGRTRPMTDDKTQSDEPVVAAVGTVVDENGVYAEGGIAVQGNQALLVARFADMDAASVAYEALRDAEAKRAIDIEGVLVVDADYQGKIKVRKLTDHHTRRGTAWGAVAGVALAIIFPPRSSRARSQVALSGPRSARPATSRPSRRLPRSSPTSSPREPRASSRSSRSRRSTPSRRRSPTRPRSRPCRSTTRRPRPSERGGRRLEGGCPGRLTGGLAWVAERPRLRIDRPWPCATACLIPTPSGGRRDRETTPINRPVRGMRCPSAGSTVAASSEAPDRTWCPSRFRPRGSPDRGFDWRYGAVAVMHTGVSEAELRSISTPDRVESRLGVLEFDDGAPSAATAALVYDHLDFAHAVEAYLGALPGVSLEAIRRGFHSVGVEDDSLHAVLRPDGSQSLFLTANCDTIYFWGFIDLSEGPKVIDIPPLGAPTGILGTVDDMWFRWLTDVGLPGPDRAQGGRYLFVGPEYDGPLPDGGFFVSHSRTTGSR